MVLTNNVVLAAATLSPLLASSSLVARHGVVHEPADGAEAGPGQQIFRDFGTMWMYDAGSQYAPLVLPCHHPAQPHHPAHLGPDAGGIGGCCGDGHCQQSCLGRANCDGGHESPHNCPSDCPTTTVTDDGQVTHTRTVRRLFELSTEQVRCL